MRIDGRKTGYLEIVPHKIPPKTDRRKKNRKRRPDEPRKGCAPAVRVQSNRCSNCGQRGHNIKKYIQPIVAKPQRQKTILNKKVNINSNTSNEGEDVANVSQRAHIVDVPMTLVYTMIL